MIPMTLREEAELVFDGDVVSIDVSAGGELLVATSPADADTTHSAREVRPSGVSFPQSLVRRYELRVSAIVGGKSTESVVLSVPVAHPRVQRLPAGWLIVGARARWTPQGGERNAFVFDPEGKQVGEFCVGDGVQSVQATASGLLWVSYFDEGVFGNFGWGFEHDRTPVGASGLVCWSSEGERLLDFVPPADGLDISDCYALNVVGEEAWTCYYSEFPIVRVSADGGTAWWPNAHTGADQLAVAPPHVALVGGYSGACRSVTVVELDGSEARVVRSGVLTLPDGSELPASAQVVCRGHMLHVLSDGKYYTSDVDSLAHAETGPAPRVGRRASRLWSRKNTSQR